MVRCLQHGTFRILQKPSHGGGQERSDGNVIAIENCNEFPVGNLQGVVKISGLCVQVVAADHVLRAATGGKLAKLRPAAVIKNVDLELILRPIEALRREYRCFHDLKRFVVTRHINIDCRPQGAVKRQGNGFAPEWPGVLDIPQDHDDPRVEFGHQQACAKE